MFYKPMSTPDDEFLKLDDTEFVSRTIFYAFPWDEATFTCVSFAAT